ncbi:MAG: hypothetical protein LBT58_00195 [Endomicrobium sp.]|jgi:uncharacterized protein (UPF0333 family)|nr:hypothetical protein [Endomicrobium sp.]
MKKNKGQTLTEFVLVFVVLIVATMGVLAAYKRFWKTKYQKASSPSGALAGSVTRFNYVK